jgi:hypothetical protein
MKPGPKRPRDPNLAAKQIIDIISGEVEDTLSERKKSGPSKRRAGGLKGGARRAKRLSAVERTDIARIAANARWKKG